MGHEQPAIASVTGDSEGHDRAGAEQFLEKCLLRRIERVIDFSFIDRCTEALHSHTGRPSVPPQALERMMAVGYLFGITSERPWRRLA